MVAGVCRRLFFGDLARGRDCFEILVVGFLVDDGIASLVAATIFRSRESKPFAAWRWTSFT